MSARKLSLKEWVYEMALKECLHPDTIYRRYYKGKYPHLKLERVNARVIYVLP